jgi:hypothetical protein
MEILVVPLPGIIKGAPFNIVDKNIQDLCNSILTKESLFHFGCSMGSILGCRAEIIQLDVTDVKMGDP